MEPMEALRLACERVGGVTALAVRLGVEQPVVSNWIKRGRVPVDPVNQVLAIERETGVARHDLRPDIYPLEANGNGNEQGTDHPPHAPAPVREAKQEKVHE